MNLLEEFAPLNFVNISQYCTFQIIVVFYTKFNPSNQNGIILEKMFMYINSLQS